MHVSISLRFSFFFYLSLYLSATSSLFYVSTLYISLDRFLRLPLYFPSSYSLPLLLHLSRYRSTLSTPIRLSLALDLCPFPPPFSH